MDQAAWEKAIKEWMTNGGWVCDRDDAKTLGFSFVEGERHWIRDYCKKEWKFVQFDGNERVNLFVSKE